MSNEKTRRKKYKRSFQYIRMPVSRLYSPRYIAIKYNNGDKNSKTVQRKNRSHKK